MPALGFTVLSAASVPFAAAPTIVFQLQITNLVPTLTVQYLALHIQIMIEAGKRTYPSDERQALSDLFGEPERWSRTLHPLLWTHVNVTVSEFAESTTVEVPVPCTFDFNVAATKYFHGVQTADVPLLFQFSGTIFHRAPDSTLQIARIAWDRETKFRLPAQVWHEMMEAYYPNSAWLRVRRDIFERLYEYKRRQGLATWEQTIERLLPLAEEAAS